VLVLVLRSSVGVGSLLGRYVTVSFDEVEMRSRDEVSCLCRTGLYKYK
jgi:hypothetical protein